MLSNEEIRDFIGTVTHQLRSPLLAAARLLKAAKARHEWEYVHRAEDAISQAQRVIAGLRLLHPLLVGRRIEQMPTVTTGTQIVAGLADVVRSSGATHCQLAVSPSLTLLVETDTLLLSIANFLSVAGQLAFSNHGVELMTIDRNAELIFRISYFGLSPPPLVNGDWRSGILDRGSFDIVGADELTLIVAYAAAEVVGATVRTETVDQHHEISLTLPRVEAQ